MGPRRLEPAPGPVVAAERGHAGRAPVMGQGGVPGQEDGAPVGRPRSVWTAMGHGRSDGA